MTKKETAQDVVEVKVEERRIIMSDIVKLPKELEREFQKWKRSQVLENPEVNQDKVEKYKTLTQYAREIISTYSADGGLVKYDNPDEKLVSHGIRMYLNELFIDGESSDKEKFKAMLDSADAFQVAYMEMSHKFCITFHYEHLYA